MNGKLLLKAASPTFAAFLAGHLRRLSQLAPGKREGAIEEILTQSLDASAVQRRWTEFQKQTGKVRLVTNLLFGYLFVLAPLLIWFWASGCAGLGCSWACWR